MGSNSHSNLWRKHRRRTRHKLRARKKGVFMPYDQALDVSSFKESKEFEETRITVGVFSYNEGIKKLQISRENKNQNEEWRFAKLGRLTKEEAQEIVPIMLKAVETM